MLFLVAHCSRLLLAGGTLAAIVTTAEPADSLGLDGREDIRDEPAIVEESQSSKASFCANGIIMAPEINAQLPATMKVD